MIINKVFSICISIVVGLSIMTGCASKPEEIRATKISPLKYHKFDCEQIIGEMDFVSTSTRELFESLKKRREDDNTKMGVGLILFWPTLFFLDGDNDVENLQYANLKGEYEALRVASVQKKCGFKKYPSSPTQIVKEYEEKAKQQQKEEEEKSKQ